MAPAQRLLIVLKGCAGAATATDDATAAAEATGSGELCRSEHNQVPEGRDAHQDQRGAAGDQDALVEV